MLHTFFFALSFVTDYQPLAELLRDGVRFGLINAGLVGLAVLCLSLRRQRAARNSETPVLSRAE